MEQVGIKVEQIEEQANRNANTGTNLTMGLKLYAERQEANETSAQLMPSLPGKRDEFGVDGIG